MKSLLFALLLSLTAIPALADDAGSLVPPKGRPVRVAVVLGDMATMIDFAGPWEVFQDVNVVRDQSFDLYTVSGSKAPVHTTGGANGPGMSVNPDYSFADAPQPDLVIVGAQAESPGLIDWLQKMHARDVVVVSVCTGAFKLAKAGLLDGLPATTHHDFFDAFAQKYPKVKLVRSSRYVQSSPRVFTAGGLTSGIDGALHIVAEYYGSDAAQATADYMEYQGTAWKTNVRGDFGKSGG